MITLFIIAREARIHTQKVYSHISPILFWINKLEIFLNKYLFH